MGEKAIRHVAAGELNLIPIHDGLGASIAPPSCIVRADFDGSSPDLSQAYTEISLLKGGERIAFNFAIIEVSDRLIECNVLKIDAYTVKLSITNIPTTILSGCVKFELTTEYGSTINGSFSISVVRESTMLDWIQDWDNNKTQIGSTYLISPKIFVGKRVSLEDGKIGQLTGVYIGPDTDKTAGLYGYKEGKEIFYINELGGSIGGWQIDNGGIQTSDGHFKILSEGSIFSENAKKEVHWGIYKSGDALFANGNVSFHSDGSAEFKGKITSMEGDIAGWSINNQLIYSSNVILDSLNNYIGVSPLDINSLGDLGNGFDHKRYVALYGGVYMHYSSDNSFGIAGYLPMEKIGNIFLSRKVFNLGSTNSIAGWNFDWDSLWIGSKLNIKGQYTSNNGSITLGTEGLRGNGWYIDADGNISFMKGLVSFDGSVGDIVGWKLTNKRLSASKTVLVSEDGLAGLYLSVADISNVATTYLSDNIQKNGGIYIKSNANDTILGAYKKNGKVSFYLSSIGSNIIGGWNFNENAIYSGVEAPSGFTSKDGDITIGSSGIRGFKWRLEADGSGSLAGNNISWDKDGSIKFSDSVQLKWSQITGITTIDKNGIYTGTVSADSITSGTISAANIKNKSETWHLKQDGSGFLANGNIKWDVDGKVLVNGTINSKNFYRPFMDIDHALHKEGGVIDPDIHGTAFHVKYHADHVDPFSDMEVYLPVASKYPGLELLFFTPSTGVTRVKTSQHHFICQEPSFLYFYEKELNEGEGIPDLKSFLISHQGGMIELISTGEQWLIKRTYGYVVNEKWEKI